MQYGGTMRRHGRYAAQEILGRSELSKMVKNMNEALDGIILFIWGLSLEIYDQRGLLEDSGVKDVTLLVREGSWEDLMEPLRVKSSWVRRGQVGQQGHGVCGGGKGRQLKNDMFAPCNLYMPFCCLYDDKTADACFKFCSGSQVFSTEEYPFQDTR